LTNIIYVLGIGAAAAALYYGVGMASASQNDLTAVGGPDYTLTNLTRAKVSKWSKAALIQYGYWDAETNAPTPEFYKLPGA
jgi:hypothetical protein